jgi:hypothetical protein
MPVVVAVAGLVDLLQILVALEAQAVVVKEALIIPAVLEVLMVFLEPQELLIPVAEAVAQEMEQMAQINHQVLEALVS